MDMTDVRKNWQERTKTEEELLQKFIMHNLRSHYHHKHFRFIQRKNGKPRFYSTSNRKLMGEEIFHYAKFVYWSLLIFYVNKNHTLQSAHDFTMKTMRARLSKIMITSITSGTFSHRTLTAMQTLGLKDVRLKVYPKKSNPLLQLTYLNSDFTKEEDWLDIDKDLFDEKKGHDDIIQKMADQYKKDIHHFIPFALNIVNLKTLMMNHKTIQYILYPHERNKIPKWIYWSLMKNVYQESFFIEKNGKYYPSIGSAHLCHVRVVNAMEKIFDENFVAKIFSGGSWIGKNDTVTVMKKIGIMDVRKYPGIFGCRLCLFAKPLHVTPIMMPSMKELSSMRQSARDRGRRYWRP